jgi:hypothetical protein
MKLSLWRAAALALLGVSAFGQRYEIGAGAGGSFYTSKSVTAGQVTGNAKFDSGWGATAYVGHNSGRILGGELRYLYQANDSKLSSGSANVTFGARSHTIHYDFLLHAAKPESKVRPFVAFGAGFKGYQGTGTERVVQPLSNLAFLTRTTEWRWVATVGAGVKFKVNNRLGFRAEFKDYISEVPTNVIAPAPGAKLDGIFHNFVALFGLSLLF